MNEHDLLKELENLNDDSEPGFLKGLSQKAPHDLHLRIMNSIQAEVITKEEAPVIELKRRMKFDYRRYASFTAAAAVLVFAFIGGANQLLNTKITPELITHKTGAVTQSKIVNSSTTTKTPNVVPTIKMATDYGTKHIDKSNIVTSNVVDKPKAKPTKPGKTTLATDGHIKNSPGKSTLSRSKIAPTILAKSTKSPDNVIENITPDKTANNNGSSKLPKRFAITKPNDPANFDVNIKPIDKSTGNDTPDINAAGAATKPGDDPNNTKTTNDPGTTASITNPDNSDGGTVSTAPNDPTDLSPNGNAAKNILASMSDVTINYEISLDLSQTDIIQFIKEKGVTISDDSYKLNKTDFETLDQMLAQNNIQKTLDNEVTDQFVFIKINLK